MKTQQSTGLTHELKSPVSNIIMTTDIMVQDLDRLAKDPAKLADYLGVVQKNAARLESFVHDLLNIAKIQDGNFTVDKKTFDLSETAVNEADHFRPMCAHRNVDLHIHVEPQITFEGDQEKIRQTVSNLLSNALKFTSQGKIRLEIARRDAEIIGSVTDDGRGITPDELPKIFDRFYHGKHSSKGAGVGLTIAKAWVEAHGGKIWAESGGEGKGAKVTFTLPV